MPSTTVITTPQLSRLVGLPDTPLLVDVRTEEDFTTDRRVIPGSRRRDFSTVATWAHEYAGRDVVVSCARGGKLSQGAAAWLRTAGARAESLEGGFNAWREAGQPLLEFDRVPPIGADDRTVWVTRARPKVDRIACPWLIRRFVDPGARFLFVTPADVAGVAERFHATPFDVEGVYWSHRGDGCTFDTMVEEFGLRSDALDRLSVIIRGADTARTELAPQAAGVLAALLGFSRMYRDDLEQLEAALPFLDALYRWSRDAVEETHNWPLPRASA